MADLYNTLQQLLNPTTDLGGAGGGPDDARAMAQLILGGGKASTGGISLFGGAPVTNDAAIENNLGPGVLDPTGRTTGKPINVAAPSASMIPLPPVPIRPQFQDVLNTADRMADSVTSRRNVTKTLLPNPYGPGSYDPTDEAAVADIKKQGAAATKLNQVREFLSSDFLSRLPPGSPVKDIVAGLLESAGVTKSEAQKAKEVAQARAEGEIAAGKGVKKALPQDLMSSIGKPGFEARMTQAIAAGEITDPNLQARIELQHNNLLKAARVDPADRRVLSGIHASTLGLQDMLNSYEATPAFQSGKFSDTMRAALATNSTAATFENMVDLPLDGKGFTDADRTFAAKYNAVRASLRDFSSDTRFSDTDKADVLRGIGNPATGPKSFPKQVNAMIDRLTQRQSVILNDLEATGRDVGGLRDNRGSKTVPQGSVRVVRKDGKAGYIPASQLKEALASGEYTQ